MVKINLKKKGDNMKNLGEKIKNVNMRSVVRGCKHITGFTNTELERKANEMELASKSKKKISDAKITKVNAKFENEKNEILNDCEKEHLECELSRLKCNNMIQKSKNKVKKSIIKNDTSTGITGKISALSKILVCLLFGIVSTFLSVGGMYLSSDRGLNMQNLGLPLVFIIAITANNLFIQSFFFNTFRLKRGFTKIASGFISAFDVIGMFTLSIITNNITMDYFLQGYNFSSGIVNFMSILLSVFFDGFPLAINISKLDFKLCNYNTNFINLLNDINNENASTSNENASTSNENASTSNENASTSKKVSNTETIRMITLKMINDTPNGGRIKYDCNTMNFTPSQFYNVLKSSEDVEKRGKFYYKKGAINE